MHKSHKKKRCRDRQQKSQSPIISEISETDDLSDESRNGTYTIKQSEEFGRYIVAAKDLKPGTLLICEDPLMVGPCASGPPVCLRCHVPLSVRSSEAACPGCRWPLCAVECAGPGHCAAECAVLARGATPSEGYGAIAPLRCLLLRDSQPHKWRALRRMHAHEPQRQRFKQRWEEEGIEVVDRIRNDWKADYTEQDIRDVCGILQVNAFEVGRRGISIRALYPRAFLLAHNCVPNTTHTDEDDSFRLTLRTSTRVSAGDLITLTYAYTLQNTLCRREHLYMGKFFWCQCQRCIDPTELGSNAGTLRCPKCHQGTVMAKEPLNDESSWVCANERCDGYEIQNRTIRLLMDKINDEVEAVDGNDVTGLESFLHRYRNVLHPTHYHCLGVKHSLSQLYGKAAGYLIHELSPKLLQRKVDICRELMQVFDVLEPDYSRLRGMTLYELHAPLMIQATRAFEAEQLSKAELRERLQEVVRCLQEAAVILGLEPDGSAEHIMACAAQEALTRIRDWEKILGKIC